MGVNNKARRAAKRRKQRKESGHGSFSDAGGGSSAFGGFRDEARVAYDLVVAALAAICWDGQAAQQAERLAHANLRPDRVATAVAQRLAELTTAVVRRCWTPLDLMEIGHRRLAARHLPFIAALLTTETERHPAASVSPAWREELTALGPARQPEWTDVTDLQLGLELGAVLDQLPRIAEVMPIPGVPAGSVGNTSSHAGASGTASKLLAKVRALLAKAESTEFPDEAEALSAKAQELIASGALERFAGELDADEPDEPLTVRRLWLDSPYVAAKGMLVNAVATANHCRSVLSERLGFVTLVGHSDDVEASELLVTSLLVQANRAMLRYGRLDDRWGRSRTTSFRRSFLLAYATRIGQRLRAAADETLAASAHSGDLVPVLARADERVRATTQTLFPETTTRSATVSNGAGWAAGCAAADLALLDVREAIGEEAAS